MECRGSVAFGGVDVGAAVEECVRGYNVLALDSVDEGSRFGRERKKAPREQYADPD